jgi:hypothetical protein
MLVSVHPNHSTNSDGQYQNECCGPLHYRDRQYSEASKTVSRLSQRDGFVHRLLERDARARPRISASFEDYAKLMSPSRVIEQRMHANTVKEDRGTPVFAYADIESADHSGAVLVGPVSHSNIGREG